MKTSDYINSLIKENMELEELCKSHVKTIRLIKRELTKLNNTILKKDKKIIKLENESLNIKTQKELDILQNDYNNVVNENMELKHIFDDIESTCDSE